ncbi:hypothetical protein O3597_14255 [Verrucosispora sp. WMMA2044]|uniref:hypothetical protein n=1 Tax=Micromonospora TaxID=1873 RepID=UPI001F4857F8|nr:MULTISPECIES: hypothetical protein [Micromonospora]WBB51558.1 hypothetical protein O3597_14255 [Verrucosispora sp. WMMA2044]
MDLLIAVTARAHDAAVYTGNADDDVIVIHTSYVTSPPICEDLFQDGKGQDGLDHFQGSWAGCHRLITLVMLALAVLTILAAAQSYSSSESL